MSAGAQLAVIAGVLACGLAGWVPGGHFGALAGLTVGLALLVVPWRRQPLWAWAGHYLGRNRPVRLPDPVTVANDRSGGGLRYHRGVAITAVHIPGRPFRPAFLTGATSTRTDNTVDLAALIPMMRQSLGLTIDSISAISIGSRRRSTGDYARVYDSLIGPCPYAGRRETWLIIRIRALDNADALRWRTTVGAAAVAATQRIAADLRRRGLRARVATATEITELDNRIGRTVFEPRNRRWTSLRGDTGWITSYGYRPQELTAETLGRAWAMQVDGLIQNVTLFPDGTCSAALTVHTAQPPTDTPATTLSPLPGEQVPAALHSLCAARPSIRGLARGRAPRQLSVAVGSSGILLGRLASGDRILLPLTDPGSHSSARIVAEDAIAKRIIIRAAAAGERLTVHTADLARWASVRMPHVIVTDQSQPAPGTTISVTDGTIGPAPRPRTVIDVCTPGSPTTEPADVVITQSGPATVRVGAAGADYDVEMEFFRAENRYLTTSAMAQ